MTWYSHIDVLWGVKLFLAKSRSRCKAKHCMVLKVRYDGTTKHNEIWAIFTGWWFQPL